MTKPTLTINSTDLSEYVQSMKVEFGPPPEPYKHSYTPSSYRWESVHDATVRHGHTESPVMEWIPPTNDQFVGRLIRDRCSMVNLDGYLKNLTNTNLLRLIRKALRTYPKRMSRAQRKEARAREQRRLERNRKQITRSR